MNWSSDVHLSVELVCSFADRSAAFPPIADPCQMWWGVVEGPEGTHSPAEANEQKIKIFLQLCVFER